MAYILGTHRRTFRTMNAADKILLLCFACIVLLCLCRFFAAERESSFSDVFSYVLTADSEGSLRAGILLQGVFMTLRLSFWCLLVAFVSGTFVGIATARKKGLAVLPGTLYVTVLRNMPPLILLFLVFFFASSVLTEFLLNVEYTIAKSVFRDWFYVLVAPQGQLDRMVACVLTLGLYEGAYIAEIVRAGIESVPYGQWEAGKASGLTPWQIRRLIIAPQALRQSLAPLAGQSISTVKDSAIASVISLQELTFQSMELMNVSGKTVELWLLTAFLYFVLCVVLEKISHAWEASITWKPLH